MAATALLLVAVTAATAAAAPAADGAPWTLLTPHDVPAPKLSASSSGAANPFPRVLADYQCAFTAYIKDQTYVYNMSELAFDGAEQSPPSAIGSSDRDYVAVSNGDQSFTFNICKSLAA